MADDNPAVVEANLRSELADQRARLEQLNAADQREISRLQVQQERLRQRMAKRQEEIAEAQGAIDDLSSVGEGQFSSALSKARSELSDVKRNP